MSNLSDTVYAILKEVFPLNTIKKEHYVLFKGNKLFFDFYLKDLCVLVEVQGQQHFKFIKHFHGDREAFLEQKRRDNLKKEFLERNLDLCLVYFYYNDIITKDLVLNKIHLAIKGRGNE